MIIKGFILGTDTAWANGPPYILEVDSLPKHLKINAKMNGQMGKIGQKTVAKTEVF